MNETVKIKDMADGERPREKMLRFGASSLSNTELLAVLISSGTREESAVSLASRVLSMEKGGLGDIAAYHPEEFKRLKGIGDACACRLAACFELGRRTAGQIPAQRPKIDCPDSAALLLMEDMRHLRKEVFRVLLLNVKNEVLSQEDISVGGVESASAAPREVFSSAVRKGAYSVILVHNHPSGDPFPSAADISTTRQLVSAGELLGVRVLDHIIIGDGIYRSLKEMGIIN